VRVIAVLCVAGVLSGRLAHADDARDAEGFTADERAARAQQDYDKRQYIGARLELLAAFQIERRPRFLFALGQTAYNLARYEEAIDFWKMFLRTEPEPEQAALAQQAIGHATEKIHAPLIRPEPAPVYVRRWDGTGTALVVAGGLAIAGGLGSVAYAHSLGDDASGTERDYHGRVVSARHFQWGGIAGAATGAALVGVALVRWRFHFERELEVSVTPGGVAIGGSL
jgi:tetratricopeptide (TPR) repeat protein